MDLFGALAEQGPLVTFAIALIVAILRGDLVTKREYLRASDLADSYLALLEGQTELTERALDAPADSTWTAPAATARTRRKPNGPRQVR